jgi:hypothetical protein
MKKILLVFLFMCLNVYAGNTSTRLIKNLQALNYSPTFTPALNIVSVTNVTSVYVLNYNLINIYGQIDVQIDANAGQPTIFSMSLPAPVQSIMANFGLTAEECSGTFRRADGNSLIYTGTILPSVGTKNVDFLGETAGPFASSGIRMLYDLKCQITLL